MKIHRAAQLHSAHFSDVCCILMKSKQVGTRLSPVGLH